MQSQVAINKYEGGEDNTHRIEDYCRKQGIRLAAKIPFEDDAVTEAIVHGVPVVEYADGGVSREIKGAVGCHLPPLKILEF